MTSSYSRVATADDTDDNNRQQPKRPSRTPASAKFQTQQLRAGLNPPDDPSDDDERAPILDPNARPGDVELQPRSSAGRLPPRRGHRRKHSTPQERRERRMRRLRGEYIDEDEEEESESDDELLFTKEETKAIVRKLDRYLVLFLAILYMLSFLDRSSM